MPIRLGRGALANPSECASGPPAAVPQVQVHLGVQELRKHARFGIARVPLTVCAKPLARCGVRPMSKAVSTRDLAFMHLMNLHLHRYPVQGWYSGRHARQGCATALALTTRYTSSVQSFPSSGRILICLHVAWLPCSSRLAGGAILLPCRILSQPPTMLETWITRFRMNPQLSPTFLASKVNHKWFIEFVRLQAN
jgi:hypothetical protein